MLIIPLFFIWNSSFFMWMWQLIIVHYSTPLLWRVGILCPQASNECSRVISYYLLTNRNSKLLVHWTFDAVPCLNLHPKCQHQIKNKFKMYIIYRPTTYYIKFIFTRIKIWKINILSTCCGNVINKFYTKCY